LGCQTDVAERILAPGGDYVLAAKDHQKNLSEAIVEFFDDAQALDFKNIAVQRGVWVEKDPGRIETRRATLVADVSWMDTPIRQNWKNLSAVGMIEREEDIQGKITVDRRDFMASAGVKTVAQFAHATRAHWGVESMCIGCSMSSFVKTTAESAKGHAARHLSALRKFALSTLRCDRLHPDRSIRRRRKLADRRPDYHASLLGMVMSQ
jgi:predicted transposase YbfD/YdcC